MAWKKGKKEKEYVKANAAVALVLQHNGKKVMGGNMIITNSLIQMELMAILEGIRQACKKGPNIQIFTDSKLAIYFLKNS